MFVFVIKSLREKKNISQYKLSQITNLSRTYLRNLENNKKCNPTMSVLQLIADALDVNIKDLFYSHLDIDELKKEMYHRIDLYGKTSKETIEISQIIDLLINVKMREG